MTNDTGIGEVVRRIDKRLTRIEAMFRDNPSPPVMPDRSYTRSEAARFLGVSTWLIDRARKDGLLRETRRLGPRHVRITGESLMTWMRQAQESSVLKI